MDGKSPQLVSADAYGISAAVAALRLGHLVGLPTETVYGLAADATDPVAVARIYAAKGRPHFNPLIAHVPDVTAAERQGVFDSRARALAAAFWPGPLTLVVPVGPDGQVCELARAGLPSIALRAPAHPVSRAVLSAFGRPVAAPSANRSGHVSATTSRHVIDDLGAAVDVVIDAGPSPVGVESTIVSLLGDAPVLLRPGGVPRDAIEVLIGPLADATGEEGRPLAPGGLAQHYAPSVAVRLDATDLRPGEALLAFGAALPSGAERAVAVLNLSPAGDLIEAAANLFGHLRALDARHPTAIAVMPVPGAGLGEAIRDRLARAAAGR